MKIRIEIEKDQLQQILLNEVKRNTGASSTVYTPKGISILVRSKDRPNDVWEQADFKAICEVEVFGEIIKTHGCMLIGCACQNLDFQKCNNPACHCQKGSK